MRDLWKRLGAPNQSSVIAAGRPHHGAGGPHGQDEGRGGVGFASAQQEAPSRRGRDGGLRVHRGPVRPTPPSRQLDPGDPSVLEKLERLDDLVFEAISGSGPSLEELKWFWPRVRSELGDPLLAESREQYLRYALRIWDDCLDADGVRNPMRAIYALDVLCLLFNET